MWSQSASIEYRTFSLACCWPRFNPSIRSIRFNPWAPWGVTPQCRARMWPKKIKVQWGSLFLLRKQWKGTRKCQKLFKHVPQDSKGELGGTDACFSQSKWTWGGVWRWAGITNSTWKAKRGSCLGCPGSFWSIKDEQVWANDFLTLLPGSTTQKGRMRVSRHVLVAGPQATISQTGEMGARSRENLVTWQGKGVLG